MSKLNKPGVNGLNVQTSGKDTGTAVSASGAVDSVDLEKCAASSVPQRDYLQLMLVQLRRVENLEQENRKLLAERDVLNEKYQEQLQIVTALKAEKILGRSSKQGMNKSRVKSSKTQALKELPAIDAAEFQPLQDQSDTGLTQGYKAIANTTAALGSSVKSSASWCGKKVVAILT